MTSVPAFAAPAPPEPTSATSRPDIVPGIDGHVRPLVRRIRPSDTARMRALRLEMLADAPLAFLETVAEAAARPHPEYADRVRQNAFGPAIAAFVAELPPARPRSTVGGQFVGHAGGHVSPDNPRLTVIFAVYVTPTRRGTGLLGELIEQVATWSRAAGRPELMLEVVVGNDRALRAYERLGFVDTGVRVRHPRVPVLTELQMRRRA